MRSGGRPDDVDNRLMLNCYFIDSACSTDSAGTTSPIVPSMAAGNGKNLALFLPARRKNAVRRGPLCCILKLTIIQASRGRVG